MYRDSLDSTRFLQVLTRIGDYFVCKVFWQNEPNKAKVYGGKVHLPTRLFVKKDGADPRGIARLGFVEV